MSPLRKRRENQEDDMLAELSIVPLGRGEHLSSAIAEVLDVVDRSGIRYKFTPCGTCLEGSWDEVMDVVGRAHARARQASRHVLTTLRIEDEEGENDKLTRNVTSVEEKLGRQLAETGGIVR
jgi:uncharacterized protein (TIGR00106 family)